MAQRDLVREERDVAQAEIEKLRLLIRQLQRGRFGRRSEKLDPDQRTLLKRLLRWRSYSLPQLFVLVK